MEILGFGAREPGAGGPGNPGGAVPSGNPGRGQAGTAHRLLWETVRTPKASLIGEKLFNFSRGQKRGRDTGPEKGLFGKTTPIKLINIPNNLENLVFLKKSDFDEIYV